MGLYVTSKWRKGLNQREIEFRVLDLSSQRENSFHAGNENTAGFLLLKSDMTHSKLKKPEDLRGGACAEGWWEEQQQFHRSASSPWLFLLKSKHSPLDFTPKISMPPPFKKKTKHFHAKYVSFVNSYPKPCFRLKSRQFGSSSYVFTVNFPRCVMIYSCSKPASEREVGGGGLQTAELPSMCSSCVL